MGHDVVVIERVDGRCGELVLVRRDEHFEIVANGVFLMDTRGGASERLHVTVSADRMPPPGRMLIGGLGVGFSLAAALSHPAVGSIHVVEREAAVLRWNRGPLAALNDDALRDPRVHAHEADVVGWLVGAPESSLDAICLDVDNGPDWLVSPGNAWLYADEGLRTATRVLSPGGVLTIWSAGPSPAFVARMAEHFADVEVTEIPAARGEPDVFIVGRTAVAGAHEYPTSCAVSGRRYAAKDIRCELKEHPVASRLNPYISFTDNARQAMEFYKDVFGGTLVLNTFGDYGAAHSPDAEKIMHGQLETDNGFTLMGADTPAGMEFTPGTNMTVSLSGDDAEDLKGYWSKLAEGGAVTMPLEKQMWGDEFGMLVDKFGVPWMVNIGAPTA